MNAAKPYDEMHAADGAVRAHYQPYSDWLGHTPRELIARKRKEADLAFHRAIYRAAKNELVETLANFVLSMVSGWLRRSHAHGGLADTVRLHEIMYTMIETRNTGGAREAYRAEVNMEHFRRILEQMGAREDEADRR